MFFQKTVSTPGRNVPHHLYQRTFTGSITGTNEGYGPVQMSVFPVLMTLPNSDYSKDYVAQTAIRW
jgi:hypothetical protein